MRGLNDNHNHNLKNLFKGAALSASSCPSPLRFLCCASGKGDAADDGASYPGTKAIGVVITEDETHRKGRQARAKPVERNRWALTYSGLDLETKIFSTSGRGRTFSLTSLFIE